MCPTNFMQHLSTAHSRKKGCFEIHSMILSDLWVIPQKRAKKWTWRGPGVLLSLWGGTPFIRTGAFLCCSFFPPVFAVFHLADDALLLSNSRGRGDENTDFQHMLLHLSHRLLSLSLVTQLCVFAWDCCMCISRCSISFGMMCSSLISFLTPLQCDGNPSHHRCHCHFKPR